jgi:ABC-2 type transport system permease protein
MGAESSIARGTSAGLARFVAALVATNLKASLALRGTFVLQALFMMVNNLVFFTVWWIRLRRVPHLRGWRIGDVEVLFGVTAAAFGLVMAIAGGVRHLSRAIDEGELDTLLAQPKPVLPYAVGARSHASGVGDVLSGLLFLGISGHLTLASAPLALLAILASAAVLLASGIAFFSLAFWLSRTESLSRQLWELVITFALYPEPLFGGVLRLMLFTLLPAGFIGYLPARIVREPSVEAIALLLAGASVYLGAACWLFGRGLRRYASGSRFVVFG